MSNARTVLSLCDYSGVWSQPYEDAGYQVVRVDIARGQDVRLLPFPGEVHGILAAPPCTHFSRAGARLWEAKGDAALLEGLSVVDACLRLVVVCRPSWWVMENPIGRLQDYIGQPVFKFDPCDFGDPWTKRTWLWGHFAPPVAVLAPAGAVAATQGDRTTATSGRGRSTTPAGFARAFYEANP